MCSIHFGDTERDMNKPRAPFAHCGLDFQLWARVHVISPLHCVWCIYITLDLHYVQYTLRRQTRAQRATRNRSKGASQANAYQRCYELLLLFVIIILTNQKIWKLKPTFKIRIINRIDTPKHKSDTKHRHNNVWKIYIKQKNFKKNNEEDFSIGRYWQSWHLVAARHVQAAPTVLLETVWVRRGNSAAWRAAAVWASLYISINIYYI